MTVFRAATLRTFFFAFHAGAKEEIMSRTTHSVKFWLSTYTCSRENILNLQHYETAAPQSFQVFLKIKNMVKA